MQAKSPTEAAPLSEAEIHELDQLLAAIPAPYEAMDVVMLDGYLCGILVQPIALTQDQWLPPIFNSPEQALDGQTPGWDEARHNRMLDLILRRQATLLRSITQEGWFDPIIPIVEDEHGQPAQGEAALEGLGYWAAGFEWALANFTALEDLARPGVPDLLDSIWRHLPEQDDNQLALTQALNAEHPLKNLDEAIEALVFDIIDLAEIGLTEKHKVPTIKRDQPKVGRNDLCPCGSGKKYKHCHGQV